jgi:hypothetical protein
MAKQDVIRSKLQKKVFAKYGKQVTLSSRTATTYNSRGEELTVSATTSTITFVPYDVVNTNKTFQAFGPLLEGQIEAAVPYDTVIAIDDTLTMEGVTYQVKNISKSYLPDVVVQIVRLNKIQA